MITDKCISYIFHYLTICFLACTDFPVPSGNGNSSDSGSSISTGAIVGIVLGGFSAIFMIMVILWWNGCFKRKDTLEYGTIFSHFV